MGDNGNQASSYRELSGKEGLEKIGELVKGIHIAMLVTSDENGGFSSRPMGVQDKPFDGALWFLTRADSHKVEEVGADQRVLLTFAEPKDSKYVALKGTATVMHDREKVKELWSPLYKAWFPNGEDDPAIAVLRVDVTEGEYWQASSSRLVVGLKYLAAAATGGKMEVGGARHVVVR
jgi:general stress protein 26